MCVGRGSAGVTGRRQCHSGEDAAPGDPPLGTQRSGSGMRMQLEIPEGGASSGSTKVTEAASQRGPAVTEKGASSGP